MPAPARKNTETKPTETKPIDPPIDPLDPIDTGENENDTTDMDTTPEEEEMNPMVIPEGWEAIPEVDGGGIRPKTVPWVGYESA